MSAKYFCDICKREIVNDGPNPYWQWQNARLTIDRPRDTLNWPIELCMSCLRDVVRYGKWIDPAEDKSGDK